MFDLESDTYYEIPVDTANTASNQGKAENNYDLAESTFSSNTYEYVKGGPYAEAVSHYYGNINV